MPARDRPRRRRRGDQLTECARRRVAVHWRTARHERARHRRRVNGDDAAAAIAVALAADELLLIADVGGVMSDGAVIPRLRVPVARELIAGGTAAGGMRAKLEAALTALAGGVERVRIGDIAAIDDATRGTVLLA